MSYDNKAIDKTRRFGMSWYGSSDYRKKQALLALALLQREQMNEYTDEQGSRESQLLWLETKRVKRSFQGTAFIVGFRF